jgi:hypothetical protein
MPGTSKRNVSPPTERAKDVRPKTDLQRDIDPYYISSIDALRTVFDVYTTHFSCEAITSYMLAQIIEAVVPSALPFVKEEVQSKLLHFNNAGLAGFTEFVDLVRHAQLAARVPNRTVCERCDKEVERMRLKRELLVNKAILGTESDAINDALGVMAHRRPSAWAGEGDESQVALPPQGMASINEGLILSISQKDSSIAEKDSMIAKLSAQLADLRPKFNAVEKEIEQSTVKKASKGKKGSTAEADGAAKSSRTQQLLARGGRSREDVLATARQLAAEARQGGHREVAAGSYTSPARQRAFQSLDGTSAVRSQLAFSPAVAHNNTYNDISSSFAFSQSQRPLYPGSAFANVTDTLPPSMPLITEQDVQQVLFDRRPLSEKLRTAPALQTTASSTAGSLATSEVVRMNGAYHALQLEKRLTQTSVKNLPIHGSHTHTGAVPLIYAKDPAAGAYNVAAAQPLDRDGDLHGSILGPYQPLVVATGGSSPPLAAKTMRSNPLTPHMMFGSNRTVGSAAPREGGRFDTVM